MLRPLPIDAVLPAIVRAAETCGAVVIEAPPGAGKTTRVPRALLDAGLADGGEIWVLEPRRLPARMAASRVAAELGEPVGETVGYAVRFEEVAGPQTRLRFMTEGLFVRRVLAEPRLPGVSAVVLDELHERHVATDLALAWLRQLREARGDRTSPAPRVVAMSATLDAEPVRALLAGSSGRAEVVRSEGRLYDVTIEHLPQPDERPLDRQVTGAVRRLLREERDGDVLVFLPGAADIRRAQAAIAELPEARGQALAVMPLHGEMPLEDQTRAVRPLPDGRRKVVLATNVAESSITIDGVVGVVDSGLARIAGHSPWTGLPTLATAKISQAAAVQRAGRAGRTRPGRALRLYTRHDFEQRRPQELPEIARADLADLALTIAALGLPDADALEWLDPPPPSAWGAARALLITLGAVDEAGRLTARGRDMARFGVHPRLARLVVEGATQGVADPAAVAAALISERDIRLESRARFRGDGSGSPAAEVSDLVDLFFEAEAARFRPEALRRLEIDARAVSEVARLRDQLRSAARGGRRAPAGEANGSPEGTLRALRLSVLAAFPDRVARRRAPGAKTVLLANGGSAELGLESAADWFAAVDVQERKRARLGGGGTGGGTELRLASVIEPEWLIDLFPDRIEEVDRRAFNPETQRVERSTGLRYGALVLDETIEPAPRDEDTARLLGEAVLARGLERLPGGDELPAVLARLAFARQATPEVAWPCEGDADLRALVRAACLGRNSVGELMATDSGGGIGDVVLAALSPEARQALERVAPASVTLPGGRRVRIRYDDTSGGPWIESRLQDFFGMQSVPRLAGGGVPLTIHLLAPNGRAVQVTRDLPGFWRQHYPALRRELQRRYPRHAWPEDGATARPPSPTARRPGTAR